MHQLIHKHSVKPVFGLKSFQNKGLMVVAAEEKHDKIALIFAKWPDA